jgi:hypothetical protein
MTERERIEARLMEFADVAAAAVSAGSRQRLVSYKTSIGNVFQCPRCWVEKAEQRRLHPHEGLSEMDAVTAREIVAYAEPPPIYSA